MAMAAVVGRMASCSSRNYGMLKHVLQGHMSFIKPSASMPSRGPPAPVCCGSQLCHAVVPVPYWLTLAAGRQCTSVMQCLSTFERFPCSQSNLFCSHLF